MIGAMRLALALAAVALVTQAPQVKLDPDLGVTDTLAKARSARISSLRYDLAFTIPAEKTKAIDGRELIRFSLRTADEPIVLDFAPDRAGILLRSEVNGAQVPVRQVNGHIIVPSGRATTRSRSSSTPATSRSIAATTSSTRFSCHRARTSPFPASTSRT